jgi:DNA/RNA-binding domain of Phe-tRNA-synthetase-like protein
MAAYDLTDVKGKIRITFANKGDEIVRIGETEPTEIEKGELVYRDEDGVICMDYNYRDADRTKIEPDTNKVVIFVDGHEGISEEDISEAMELLAGRVLSFTDAKIIGKNIKT